MAIIGTSGCRYRSRLLLAPAFKRSIADGYHAGALGALRRSFGVQTACIVFILPRWARSRPTPGDLRAIRPRRVDSDD